MLNIRSVESGVSRGFWPTGLVYYCVWDISYYIVLAHCKVCSIAIFSGVKLLVFITFSLGQSGIGTAVRTIRML